jgi:hypothetical protein
MPLFTTPHWIGLGRLQGSCASFGSQYGAHCSILLAEHRCFTSNDLERSHAVCEDAAAEVGVNPVA